MKRTILTLFCVFLFFGNALGFIEKGFINNPLMNKIQDSDGDTGVYTEYAIDEDKIRLFTAGVERVVVDEYGNVGIGTTTPGYLLDVCGDKGTSFLAVFRSPNDSASLLLLTEQATGDYASVGLRRVTGSGEGWNFGMGPSPSALPSPKVLQWALALPPPVL
jgi:hypothetical protein